MCKHYHKVNIITMLVFLIATFFSTSALFLTNRVSATDPSVTDEINLTVPVSCSLSGTGMDSHVTTLQNGHSNSTIGESTITAYCNDLNGFSIYAIGYTNDEYGNTFLIDSSLPSTNNIPTGTATSGNTSNWAMKLTPITTPTPTYPITITGSADDTDKTSTTLDYTTFQSIPAEYALVAKRKAATDVGTNAEGSSFKTTYQAYAASGQAAGTYTGQVKYTLVHPYTEAPLQPQTATSGCINYFPNGSNVEGTMGCQSISDTATSARLLASNFSRTGYGFAGWSNKFDYATNPNQEGIKFYGPQETITFTAGEYTGNNNGLALYAVWVKSQGSIQDRDKVASVCSSLATATTDGTANLSSVSAFTDSRDNNTYAIAKLADGNCWMIENLRLDNTAEHNSDGALAQGYGGQFAGLADPETAWANNIATANSLYSTDGANDTISIGTSNAGYRFPRYNNINTPTNTADRPQNPTTNDATNSTSNASMYSYGNYYTWAAAIADTIAYTSDNISVTNTSICPSGWHLPKGGDKSNEANNEFWSLVVTGINNGTNPANYESSTTPYYVDIPEGTDASNKLRAYPNNFVYSGFVAGGSVSNRGSGGNFWSSTADLSNIAYYLYLYSSTVYPGTLNINKYRGRTVRCVAGS